MIKIYLRRTGFQVKISPHWKFKAADEVTGKQGRTLTHEQKPRWLRVPGCVLKRWVNSTSVRSKSSGFWLQGVMFNNSVTLIVWELYKNRVWFIDQDHFLESCLKFFLISRCQFTLILLPNLCARTLLYSFTVL